MKPTPAETLFHGHPLPGWVLDAQTRQVLAVNAAALTVFGYSEADFLQQRLAELLAAEAWPVPAIHADVQAGRPTAPASVQAVAATGAPAPAVWRLRHRSGSFGTFELTTTPLTFEGRSAWLQAAHDLGRESRTEEALRHLQRRYRDIVETTTEGVWIIDARAHTTFVNDTMAQMMGYAAADMISRPLADFMDARGAAITESNLERRRRGVAEQHEFCFQRRDGSPLWVRMATHPIRDDAGAYAGALAMVTDISERRQVDQELRLLATSVARFNDIVLITEAEPIDGPGPRIVFVNDAFERRTGYKRDEVLGRTPRLLQGPGTDRAELDRIKAALQRSEPVRAQLLNYTKAGQAFWVELDIVPVADENGRCRHWVAVQHEITERKHQAQRDAARERVTALMATGAPLSVVLDAIVRGLESSLPGTRCSVMLVDGHAKRLRVGSAPSLPDFFNSAAEGLPIGAEVASCGAAAFARTRVISADLQTDPRWTPYRELAVRAGLGACWSEPVLSRGGAVLGTFGVYHAQAHEPAPTELAAVSEAARMAAIAIERKGVEDALRQSQKMEALGTLAGGIAHDFNNILGAILGNLALATQGATLPTGTTERLQQVQQSAVRARGLVQQILAFSRRQPLNAVRQPLRPVVLEALALMRSTLPAGVQLDTRPLELPLDKLPDVDIDANQLQQVLMNLCTNAWHAMPSATGVIEVGLASEHCAAGSPLAALGLAPGLAVHLWVRDDGRGIADTVRPHIFEPFFTTKPIGGGTGLGLAVVHGIINEHRGCITVDSTPGRGTTFHVYLPTSRAALATPAAGAAAPAAEPAASGVASGAPHVLLVDDDAVMLVTAQALLQRSGYRVRTAGSGREALAVLQHAPGDFDAVVTDYNMPECSGFELARAAAALRPEMPVLIYSGYIDAGLREEADRLGVRALVNKENVVEDLASAVRLSLT